MIAPAILVALTSVAWTPIAERYIYLSVAFVAVGLAGCRQKPYLKMENRSETGNSAGSAIGAPDVKVVTGEPATKTEASDTTPLRQKFVNPAFITLFIFVKNIVVR